MQVRHREEKSDLFNSTDHGGSVSTGPARKRHGNVNADGDHIRDLLLHAHSTPAEKRVMFSGGILGTISNVKDQTFVVKIADNVKIEVARGAVSKVIDKGDKIESDSDK